MKKVQDYYFQLAKNKNYHARSAFKLAEIDSKYRLLYPACRVLDLGCYPGSWLQYISQKIGKKGLVVGIDQKKMIHSFPENVVTLDEDILNIDIVSLQKYTPAFDVICSDMCPSTSGIKDVDSLSSLHLCSKALDISCSMLKKKGHLLVKILEGVGSIEFRKKLNSIFQKIHSIKPWSSRQESREKFLLAMNFQLSPSLEK